MSVQEATRPGVGVIPAPARPADRIERVERVETGTIINIETITLISVLLLALVSHAFNMFNYPLYRQDEGIVSENAWSFINGWRLSPYTYNYDHPPFATFMLAVWTVITGGFHTFGPALNTGRVLMLAMHLGSVFFVYRIAKELTGSVSGATVAGLLFTLSPLAISYQRLVVVDNFMMFWVLATMYFIVCNRGRLFFFFTASLTLGFAIMCRETGIFFVIPLLVLIWMFADRYHRLYAQWGAVLIGAVVTFQFFLYAIFKGELFPQNFDFLAEAAGKADRVSMLGTIFQNYRGANPIWNGNNYNFGTIWQTWLNLDVALITAGLICAGLNLLFGFRHKQNWVVPLFLVGYGIFIGFGGVDADYMAVAVIPFLALAIGQTVGWITSLIGPRIGFVVAVCITVVASYFYLVGHLDFFRLQANEPYQQVLSWVKSNIPADSSIIIHDGLWVDLHDNWNGPAFPNAESHWKASNDPEIRVKKFKDDHRNVDFMILTDEMKKQFSDKGLAFSLKALEDSSLIRKYDGKIEPYEIRKINNQKPLVQAAVLNEAYNYYRSRFVGNDGKVTDGNGKTTADIQSQAMQMALYNNDQKTFDSIWTYSVYNFQLTDNSLFRVDETQANSTARNANILTNSRVDHDFALSLLLAGQRWKDDSYLKESLYIIRSIWDNEIITVNGHKYIKATASPAAQLTDQVLLNMGAFSPQAYRLFAQLDPEHDWMAVYNDGYATVRKAAWYGRGDYKGIGLLPGLVIMNTQNEELRSPAGDYGQKLDNFDDEAQQAQWHVVLDYNWYKSEQARDYLEGTGWFLIKYWQRYAELPGAFTNNGLPVQGSTSNLTEYAVAAAGAGSLDQIDLAKKLAAGQPPELGGSRAETEILSKAFMGNFYRKNGQGYWMRKDDFSAQQWGWMGTALHLNKLNPTFESGTTTNDGN